MSIPEASINSAITTDELARLNVELRAAGPEQIVAWALKSFPGRLALSVSFGGDGGTMLAHMVSTARPPVPILFLDTGLLFEETYSFRRRLAERLNLNVIDVLPQRTVFEQADALGPNLWERDPDRCCHERKVLPMQAALRPYDVWITAIRHGQSSDRAKAQIVSRDPFFGVVKICPLLDVSDSEITDYLDGHRLPHNPLRDQGYASIGCVPCTSRTLPGEDTRAGRWRGIGKTECGLHRVLAAGQEPGGNGQ